MQISSKGQAAVEFLMTYGWAFLVIIALIAAGVALDPLGSASVDSQRCHSDDPIFACESNRLLAGEDGLVFTLDAGGTKSYKVQNPYVSHIDGQPVNEPCRVISDTEGRGAVQILCENLSLTPGVSHSVDISYKASPSAMDNRFSRTRNIQTRVVPQIGVNLTDVARPSNPAPSMFEPFILQVDTSLGGSTSQDSFLLRVGPGTHQYNVSTTGNVTGAALGGVSLTDPDLTGLDDSLRLTWDQPGVYEVAITGDFNHLSYPPGASAGLGPPPPTDARKIVDVLQWGDIAFESMYASFRDAPLTSLSATDTPDLSRVTNMNLTFMNVSAASLGVSSWDVSNVEQFEGTFAVSLLFNEDLSAWDTSSAESFDGMFGAAFSFNQDIGSWNTSSAASMVDMFNFATSFSQDLSSWCVSQIPGKPAGFDDLSGFEGNTALQPTWGASC